MIIVFHVIVILIEKLRRQFRKIEENVLFNVKVIFGLGSPRAAKYSGPNHSLKFVRSMQHLRYDTVKDVIQYKLWRRKMHRIVDFGSANLDVARSFCKLSFPSEVMYVEIDEDLINENSYKIESYSLETNFTFHCHPIKTTVYHGSVFYPDEMLLNIDCVTAIELIEHLYPDVLEGFVYNIFGYMKAKLVIITTPNADFNVLFTDFTGFRHDDHKFEWTRNEFTSWALNITDRYPEYEVIVDGIGKGPEGVERFGHCSQIAVFARKELIDETYIRKDELCVCPNNFPCKISTDDRSKFLCKCVCSECCPKSSYGICTHCTLSKYLDKNQNGSYFTLKKTCDLPFNSDPKTEYERIMDVIKDSFLFRKANGSQCLYDFHISDLKNVIRYEELRDVFLHFGYKIEDRYNPTNKLIEPYAVILNSEKNFDRNFDMTNEPDCNRWEFSNPNEDQNFEADDGLWDDQDEEIVRNLDGNEPDRELSFENRSTNCDLLLFEGSSHGFCNNLEETVIDPNLLIEENDKIAAGYSNNSKQEKELFDEVKSITDFIIETSLNKIDEDAIKNEENEDDDDEPKADVVLNDVIVVRNEPIVLVENGDLANNNRDLEGNNYPPEDEVELPPIAVGNNLENDNGNNEIGIDNENYVQIYGDVAGVAEPVNVRIELPVDDEEEEEEEEDDSVEEDIARSSIEALLDPNSEQDLLEASELVFSTPNQDLVFDQEPYLPHCVGDGVGVHPSVISIQRMLHSESDQEFFDAEDSNVNGSGSNSNNLS